MRVSTNISRGVFPAASGVPPVEGREVHLCSGVIGREGPTAHLLCSLGEVSANRPLLSRFVFSDAGFLFPSSNVRDWLLHVRALAPRPLPKKKCLDFLNSYCFISYDMYITDCFILHDICSISFNIYTCTHTHT